MNRTHDLDATLRLLDPADRTVDPAGSRARADLDAILSADPNQTGSPTRPSPRAAGTSQRGRLPRPARRVALLGGMVAAATAVMVVAPSLSGGDTAFATWKATPDGLSDEQREQSGDGCRESLLGGAGSDYSGQLESSVTVVAERRGDWTTVLLAGADGFSALCVTDDSAGLFTHAMMGSVGTPTGWAAPTPRELFATDLGTGTMSAGDISLIAGDAGSDVVGVEYVSEEHGAVTATVNQGHFALWFPGDELMDAPTGGVDVEVTYDDGTTATARLTL